MRGARIRRGGTHAHTARGGGRTWPFAVVVEVVDAQLCVADDEHGAADVMLKLGQRSNQHTHEALTPTDQHVVIRTRIRSGI